MKLRLLSEIDEKDVVEVTPEWLSAQYDILNKKLFGGELGQCTFGIFTTGRGSQGGVLGWFKITGPGVYLETRTRRIYKRDYQGKVYVNKDNFFEICKPRIELNGNYRWTKKAALSTLVHEMCHYRCNMHGYRPTQHHGSEFRSVAFEVSRRSRDIFTVERIASAEMMDTVELNSVAAEKKKRREENKKSRLIAVLVYLNNGTIRLVMTSSKDVIEEIVSFESKQNRCSKIVYSNDPDLKAFLIEKGYRTDTRSYRYWEIQNARDVLAEIGKYEFTTLWECGKVATRNR